jgi:hypothetical protein
MGAHQFNLTILPKKGILKIFDSIPKKVDFKEIEYTTLQESCWGEEDINPMEIIHALDKFLWRADYSTDAHLQWKSYVFKEAIQQFIDHDAYMTIDTEMAMIQALVIRVDFKDLDSTFFQQ